MSKIAQVKYKTWAKGLFDRQCFIQDNVDTSFISRWKSVWKESAAFPIPNWSSLPPALNLIFSRADRWEQVRRGGHRMLLPALKTTIKLSALVHKTSLITLMDGIYSWLKNLKSLVTIITTEVYTKTQCRTLWRRRHVAGRQWRETFWAWNLRQHLHLEVRQLWSPLHRRARMNMGGTEGQLFEPR